MAVTIQSGVASAAAGASVTFDAVNSYMFASAISTAVSAGATTAGSNITNAFVASSGIQVTSGSARSGTWRNMGGVLTSVASPGLGTLWVRTA